MILEFFPPVVQALNEEAAKHPLLLAELSKLEANGTRGMDNTIACVAAYCDVVLDGSPLLEEDLEQLFHLLLSRLRKKSMLVVQ